MNERSITEQIHELRESDVPTLVVRYTEVFGKPPRVKHREWLWRRIAWKIQEQRFGGLSQVARRRLDELIAELDLPLDGDRTTRAKLQGSRRSGEPVPGTTLTRTWKGIEVATTRVEGGWEHEGVVYRSLTAVAKAVTNSHTSGRAFFGLTTGASKPIRARSENNGDSR